MKIKNKTITLTELKEEIKKENNTIEFHKCSFDESIDLNNKKSIKLKFTECEFNKNIIFRGSYKELEIIKCKFNNLVDFIYIKEISLLKITYSYFKDIVSFNDLNIELFECSLSQFSESVFFSKLIINMIDLKSTIFIKKIEFLNIENIKEIELKEKNIKNRETARIIKDSFEQQNNIIEANKFYALEMKKREKELDEDRKKGKNIFEWFVFKVHGLASNHSQDWLLALIWICIFGLIGVFINSIS